MFLNFMSGITSMESLFLAAVLCVAILTLVEFDASQ